MRTFFRFGFILFSLCVLFISLILPVSLSSQPPIDTSKLVEGEMGWGPIDADPVFCYDSMSGQLISNVYQTLIAFHGEQYYAFDPVLSTNVPTRQDITLTVTNLSAVGLDPTGSTWTDGTNTYIVTGWTDELPTGFHSGDVVRMTDGVTWRTWTVDMVSGTSSLTMQLWRGVYVFNIRTSPTINFYTSTGAVYDTFGLKDAVYCMQRLMVFDKPGYPPWMFDKPLFDVADHTGWTNSTVMELAHLTNDAIVGDYGANTLTINVGCRSPDNAFKQNLANTWGSIYSSKYYIDKGNWDGNLFNTTLYGGPEPDWWVLWDRQGLGLRGSGLHSGTTDAGLDVPTPTSYCGSGPYYIQTVDSVNYKVVFQRNPDFWLGWPAPGCNGYLDTVEIDYIPDVMSRKTSYLAGSLDTCAIPRNYYTYLLDPLTQQPVAPNAVTVANIAPTLSFGSMMFTFVLDNVSWYGGTGSFPNGIPADFFNSTDVRKAFAYSFNWSNFGQKYSFFDYRKNWLVSGLYPDYYNSSIPGYYESLSNAETELRAAVFDGTSVWDSGFTFDLPFTGGELGVDFAACSMIIDFFNRLSTYDGRSGPAFKINANTGTWDQLTNDFWLSNVPIYYMTWTADFADADDFVRLCMYSEGAFSYYQRYTAANGWGSTKDALLDQAALTPDGPVRQALYQQLQQMYYNDCPSFPVPSLHTRLFCQYWVKGWYFNPFCRYGDADSRLCPNYYTMWKADDCWYDVSGSTPGVSDGVVNMRDIAWLVMHFNVNPFDSKWVGVYGANGCVDPYGDRVCNMKDIAGAVMHFGHRANTGTP
jgi:hypothetical protein